MTTQCIGQTVVFDDDWWLYLEHIARSRKIKNMRVRVPEGKSTPIQELVGVTAEAAFGFWAGYSEDYVQRHMDVLEKSHGWQWEDPKNGIRYRVTGTETPGHLIQRTKPFTADIYVLTKVDPKNHNATLIGWATKDRLRQAPIQQKRWPGQVIESYWMPAKELAPMLTLPKLEST